MTVPFVDLKTPGIRLLEGFVDDLRDIVSRGAYTLGPELSAFESAFAAYCGAEHAMGISSGTDALRLAYLAVGVGPGNEVIVPANTFIATAEAASHIGAVPVFVDCLPDTANMDPAAIERAITPRTRAVVPVHLYGQPADMDPIIDTARRHGLAVVEDACQAHGARYKGRVAGSMGDAAAFSFYPGKNLGALGDGGALTTSDPSVAERVRLLRNHGQSDKYTHAQVGYCDRLHNLQAAFLLRKLALLDEWNDARRAVATAYDDAFSALPGAQPITVRDDVVSVYHLYPLAVDDRDGLRDALIDAGVECGIHYPVPLHLTPAYASLGYSRGDFPIAERLSSNIVSLPIHPYISARDVENVITVVQRFVS